MVFAHDTEIALQAAAALANSALEPDTLTSVADLDAHWQAFDYTGRHDRTRAELDEVRELRPLLRSLLTADRDSAAELVNATMAREPAVPRLVRHAPYDWHLHAIADDAPLASRIAVETAMAMIDLVRADEMSRLSLCDLDDCDGVVVDLTRNRSRRFCSPTCGNRAAVAAYRSRRRAAG